MWNDIFDWIRLSAAAAGGLLAWFFGAWDLLIMVLIAFAIVDYVTGVVNAGIHKELNSSRGFAGIWKKIMIFLIVGVATLLDKAIPATNGALRAAVCMFYIANEGLSILENAAKMGLPLPLKLKEMLLQLKEKEQ